MPITEKGLGWAKLKARIDRARPKVKVGIFGEAAAAKANDSRSATVGQIANAHEHGLGVPKRSWCAGTVDASQAYILNGLRNAARSLLDPRAPAGLEFKLLAQTGQVIAGLMRARISAGIAPALSPHYLKRKLARYPGATTPLIASGQMWGSIGSVVEGSAIAIAAARGAARKAAKKALARRRRDRKIAQARKRLGRAGKRVARAGAKVGKRVSRQAKRVAKQTRRLLRGRTRRRRK